MIKVILGYNAGILTAWIFQDSTILKVMNFESKVEAEQFFRSIQVSYIWK